MNSQQVKDIKNYIDSMIKQYRENGKLDTNYLEHKVDELLEVVDSYCDLINYFLENQKKLKCWYKYVDEGDYEYIIETDYGDYQLDYYQKELLTEKFDYNFWSALQK